MRGGVLLLQHNIKQNDKVLQFTTNVTDQCRATKCGTIGNEDVSLKEYDIPSQQSQV